MGTTAPHKGLSAALALLSERAPRLGHQWRAASPFPHVIIDDFLPVAAAQELLDTYPTPKAEQWSRGTYTHQRKKLTMRSGFPPAITSFFELTASAGFRRFISEVTGTHDLLDDPDLIGGGLHQILAGGFLDVHVDYNFHPVTKLHRRLNLLLYLNRGWRAEYGGYLEFWDMARRRRIANIEPSFNRAVLFETSEVSYHGHPWPLSTPPEVTRKSLAVYYYTDTRPPQTLAPEHNTLYRQTTGLGGYFKTLRAGVVAAGERFHANGVRWLAADFVRKVQRCLKGLPPENR